MKCDVEPAQAWTQTSPQVQQLLVCLCSFSEHVVFFVEFQDTCFPLSSGMYSPELLSTQGSALAVSVPAVLFVLISRSAFA